MVLLRKLLLALIVTGLLAGTAAALTVYFYFVPRLPPVETLRDVQFQTPLRVYSADHKLIAEFGEKRRVPISFEQIPQNFVFALQAAEDNRFFEHHGIDIKGLARAALQLATTGHIQSGGSTITMQVAKNFFLTRERTFERKFNEILLALIIEQKLSKEEILELYINKIYLGHRAYGIQAAANVYYGKDIDQLSVAQLAMIAGLPKAPSAYNPITNPSRALERRNWILGRMHSLAYIGDQSYEEALREPVTARYHGSDIELNAPYIAEMVRNEMFGRYGDSIYTDGYQVHTSIDSRMQEAANRALRNGLLAYTYRHGYRGPEAKLSLADNDSASLLKQLSKHPSVNGLQPGVVMAVNTKSIQVLLKQDQTITVEWDGLSWAREYKSANWRGPSPQKAADIVQPGDLIRVEKLDQDQWKLSQLPQVQGAFVAMNPQTGELQALTGGFSFYHNKFNRALQASRQPGSNLKPFIYATALESGFSPASLVNDAPVVFRDANLESNWRPENSSRTFNGPTRLRVGLYRSRNLVSIRLLRALGISHTIDNLAKFGFDPQQLPRNLSLSLGSADMTPLTLVTGYAHLANGGFKVKPQLIRRIEDQNGELIEEYPVTRRCLNCSTTHTAPAEDTPSEAAQNEALAKPLPDGAVMDPRSAYQLYDMMRDVIKRGTGTRAQALSREDLAGKTGTTNEQRDAWFSGFNHQLVASVWVGMDTPTPLGRSEYGSTAALPVWIDFMRTALAEMPESPLPRPAGLVDVQIDPATGKLAYPGQPDAITEIFKEENLPTETASAPGAQNNATTTEEIF